VSRAIFHEAGTSSSFTQVVLFQRIPEGLTYSALEYSYIPVYLSFEFYESQLSAKAVLCSS